MSTLVSRVFLLRIDRSKMAKPNQDPNQKLQVILFLYQRVNHLFVLDVNMLTIRSQTKKMLEELDALESSSCLKPRLVDGALMLRYF